MTDFGSACRNCIEKGVCGGECCGIMIFPMDFYLEHLESVQVKVKELHRFGDGVQPETEDHYCVFLDRSNRKCSVYDDRPEVCRLYGTGARDDLLCMHLKPNGNPRSVASRKQVERNLSKMLDNMKSGRRISVISRK